MGGGFIGDFYTRALSEQRRRDRVEVVYSRTLERARETADRWAVPRAESIE